MRGRAGRAQVEEIGVVVRSAAGCPDLGGDQLAGQPLGEGLPGRRALDRFLQVGLRPDDVLLLLLERVLQRVHAGGQPVDVGVGDPEQLGVVVHRIPASSQRPARLLVGGGGTAARRRRPDGAGQGLGDEVAVAGVALERHDAVPSLVTGYSRTESGQLPGGTPDDVVDVERLAGQLLVEHRVLGEHRDRQGPVGVGQLRGQILAVRLAVRLAGRRDRRGRESRRTRRGSAAVSSSDRTRRGAAAVLCS
ncbi:hypothetical protein ABC795_01210 [Blastococcus sp. HT6-30]|uniref:hypothetical protein n=1 Tax=Blastococcus sp. HT6-30 TaxID=3144843 RepID=UPI003218F236